MADWALITACKLIDEFKRIEDVAAALREQRAMGVEIAMHKAMDDRCLTERETIKRKLSVVAIKIREGLD